MRSVVEAVPFPDPPAADAPDTRDWLRSGVPRMVVSLMSSPKCEDATMLECLQIGIATLLKGHRRAQVRLRSPPPTRGEGRGVSD